MRNNIDSLTSTRGVAAVIVFIFHFGLSIYPFNQMQWLFYSGNIAVSYFFVLSGFVLFLGYADRNISYKYFISKRLARIYPAYLLALILQLVITRGDVISDKNAAWEIISSLFLVQAYFPAYVLKLNSPGWSICCEMLFYLSFPFLLVVAKQRRALFVIITVVFYFLTQLLFFAAFRSNDGLLQDWHLSHYTPLLHFNQFLVGMCGGLLFSTINQKRISKILPIVLLICILSLLYVKRNNFDYNGGLIAPLFMVLIVFVGKTNLKPLNWKPLVYFGEISYGLYIYQSPVRELMHQFNGEFNIFSDTAFFYFSLAILIIVAMLSYRFVEAPLMLFIRSTQEKKT